jgi:hypothetical protein
VGKGVQRHGPAQASQLYSWGQVHTASSSLHWKKRDDAWVDPTDPLEQAVSPFQQNG